MMMFLSKTLNLFINNTGQWSNIAMRIWIKIKVYVDNNIDTPVLHKLIQDLKPFKYHVKPVWLYICSRVIFSRPGVGACTLAWKRPCCRPEWNRSTQSLWPARGRTGSPQTTACPGLWAALHQEWAWARTTNYEGQERV